MRPASIGLVITGSLFLIACQISVEPRGPNISGKLHSTEDVSASTNQIRLMMRSLVDPMSGEIETAADHIIAQAPTPSVKRAAVEWKAQAVPALRESLFQPDPVTALFDTWVLTNQMTIYFSQGPGKDALGASSGIATAACLKLESQMQEVAASLTKSGDVNAARVGAREWASQNPITTSISHRRSTLSQAAERNLGSELTATQTVGNMVMTLDDLNRRLEIYSDQLVRQARWEAELITMELTDQLQLDQAIPLAGEAVESVERITDSVDSITGSVATAVDSVSSAVVSVEKLVPAIDRIVVVAESAPQLIAQERAAAIQALQEEMGKTIQFVREEREAALQHITTERMAALQALHQSIIEERQVMTEDINEISLKAIDHAFSRLAQIVAVVLVVILVAALIGLWLVRGMISGLISEWDGRPQKSGT